MNYEKILNYGIRLKPYSVKGCITYLDIMNT